MISLSLHGVPERNGIGSYLKFREGIVTHTKSFPDAGVILYYGDLAMSKLCAMELAPGPAKPLSDLTKELFISILRNGAEMDRDEAEFILRKLYEGNADGPGSLGGVSEVDEHVTA